ncbi:amino acid ABC transporter permease [Actinotalea fermentans]|uniref:Glutamate ABC transporter permease n=1 Tax=Actinotalea fermentans TaxID=43671 RepID=A0A511YVR5_9CELL|nr:amino acid ABC transporter permease [Actinotalea fermentans]KGM16335.1 polar amino acid ABC transporter permease [Actinotalea fermentans ATCC 43279 = JCM 9966 = DSM 3133]GEN79280.1 glutamate ABC transporter permease [Actinotalea fermentans]
MTSVLYDAPGPVTRRRERIGSVVGAVVVLALAFLALRYAAGRGVFQADHWDVLHNPPKGQSAADVWRSILVRGLGATLRAAAVAAPLALVLGLVLALWRTTRLRWLRVPAVAVVEVFRGLPVLLMMLVGTLALGMDPFGGVVFGLVVYNMAIFAEILRAGLAALPKGQAEAASAIGLSRWQSLRHVLLPQAVRMMLPSLVAQLVVLLKDSSLGFIVSYPELLKAIQNNGQYFGNRYFVALFVVGAGTYLAVNLSLSAFARWLSRRTGARAGAVGDPAGLALVASRPSRRRATRARP